MNIKTLFNSWVVVAALVMTGCAMTPIDPYVGIHATQPTSILVPPVVNKSIDVMASTSVLTTLPRGLGEKGYYIFPVNTVKSLLEFEGLMDPQEVHDVPPADLASLFHADSILYVTIHSWTSKYLVLVTQTEVDIEYQLVGKDGTPLWGDRERLTYTPKSDSTGNVFADLIVKAIESAVERAAPNYLPLTRQANMNVFYHPSYPFPPGPYAPNYDAYYTGITNASAQ